MHFYRPEQQVSQRRPQRHRHLLRADLGNGALTYTAAAQTAAADAVLRLPARALSALVAGAVSPEQLTAAGLHVEGTPQPWGGSSPPSTNPSPPSPSSRPEPTVPTIGPRRPTPPGRHPRWPSAPRRTPDTGRLRERTHPPEGRHDCRGDRQCPGPDHRRAGGFAVVTTENRPSRLSLSLAARIRLPRSAERAR